MSVHEVAPEFDDDIAAELIGRHVLVGITYVDEADQVLEQKQVHGVVVRANRQEGIVFRLEPSGKEFTLPPFTGGFERAAPGEYRLRSTGEIVVDPDYTSTWSVKRPKTEA